jgi:COMPASS component SWD2
MADTPLQDLQEQKVPISSSNTPQTGTPLGAPLGRSATPQPSQKVSDIVRTYRPSKVREKPQVSDFLGYLLMILPN